MDGWENDEPYPASPASPRPKSLELPANSSRPPVVHLPQYKLEEARRQLLWQNSTNGTLPGKNYSKPIGPSYINGNARSTTPLNSKRRPPADAEEHLTHPSVNRVSDESFAISTQNGGTLTVNRSPKKLKIDIPSYLVDFTLALPLGIDTLSVGFDGNEPSIFTPPDSQNKQLVTFIHTPPSPPPTPRNGDVLSEIPNDAGPYNPSFNDCPLFDDPNQTETSTNTAPNVQGPFIARPQAESASFPTLDEIRAALGSEGLTMHQIARIFGKRIEKRWRDFSMMLKEVAVFRKGEMRMVPRT